MNEVYLFFDLFTSAIHRYVTWLPILTYLVVMGKGNRVGRCQLLKTDNGYQQFSRNFAFERNVEK